MRRLLVWFPLLLVLPGCVLYPRHGIYPSVGERFALEADGELLAGRSIELFTRRLGSGPPALAVLAFTGNAGLAEYQLQNSLRLLREALPDSLGVVVFAMQYPGYGRDHGPASMAACAEAGAQAAAWVHARHPDLPLVLHGVSFGSTVALHLAAQATEGVAGLVLEKPPEIRSMILCRFGWWNLWLVALPYALCLPDSVLSAANAQQVELPAVYLLGLHDGVVPPAYVEDIFAAHAGPKRLLESRTGHNARCTQANTPGLVEAFDWWARQVLR